MSVPDTIHPWSRGFTPASGFCRACRRVGTIGYTNTITVDWHHIYKCRKCGATIGAPTIYAYCSADDTLLEKDIYYTPCLHGKCTKYKQISPGTSRCEHLKPTSLEIMRPEDVAAIDLRIDRRAKIHPKSDRLPNEPQAAGIDQRILDRLNEKMKRRLKSSD